MIILFIGPPGAGKGTQAAQLAQKISVPHIATGDILRDAVKESSTLGLKAQGFMERGALVPDNEIIDLIKKRIIRSDCNNGFILDGFPRTLAQAQALGDMINQTDKQVDKVVNLEVPDSILIERLSGRRVCRQCRANYHVMNAPSKANGRCDKCSGELYQRNDDQVEVIKERLKVYKDQTVPLLDFYRTQKKLLDIRGESSITRTFRSLVETIGLA